MGRQAPLCLARCGLSEGPLIPCRPFWAGLLLLLSCRDRALPRLRALLGCLLGELCSALCTAFKASGAEACGRLQEQSLLSTEHQLPCCQSLHDWTMLHTVCHRSEAQGHLQGSV